jgi:peptidyl-prolyl cis-trans isomerase B (cyclophilin B)
MIARTVVPLALLLAALALVACGEKDEESPAADLPVGCEPVEAPAPKTEQVRRPPREPQLRGEDVTALIETSCGPVEIALETKRFPKTTSSFAHLVEAGFYKGTQFSYIDGSVVQGGDPIGDRTGGPGYSIDEPVPFATEYTRGTVAMAKTEVEPVGRSASQFFVVFAADAGLRPQFAVLGEVTHGIEVIDRIAELREPGSETGAPRAPVVIGRVTLTYR